MVVFFRELLLSEDDAMNNPDNIRKYPSSKAIVLQHNPVWRKLVVEWCYTVVDSLEIDREVVYIAIDIFDRFLSSAQQRKRPDKKAYEAAVMSSLLLATKLFSPTTNPLHLKDLADMSITSITAHDLRRTCQEIYRTVSLRKRTPTAAQFARALVQQQLPNSILLCAMKQIERSVQDEYCMRVPASLLAWMALENAMLLRHGFSTNDRERFRAFVIEASGHCYNSNLRKRLGTFLHREDSTIITTISRRSSGNNPTLLIQRVVSYNNFIPNNNTASNKKRKRQEGGLHRSKKVRSLHAMCA